MEEIGGGGGGRRKRPNADDVIAKLKDEGDFDNLRSNIIRKIKDNEELRKSIIAEVRQSAIFDQEGSESLQPKQLSDTVYQELGKKIMGQISDEVWKVIRSNENVKADIRGTVESVYNRIINPEVRKEVGNSSPSKEITINGNGKSLSPPKVSTVEANPCDGSELREPPGFGQCIQLAGDHNKVECEEQGEAQRPHPRTEEVPHHPPNTVDDDDEDMPPGFGIPGAINGAVAMSPAVTYCGGGVAGPPGNITDSVAMPPGFGTNGSSAAAPHGGGGSIAAASRFGGGGSGAMAPGVAAAAAADDDDDPAVPPGFG
ncbi:uncharacterized protein M6B38_347065 [Iris pallida]|uniref:Uncharacterized protein n=1 Tax=Iris pallida TaxID=29817 RepID=A0AAX6GU85_IRIPA|nr:uncharacterized protein M6B38_347065 [Iris pallida]